jgi:hypothetical protein
VGSSPGSCSEFLYGGGVAIGLSSSGLEEWMELSGVPSLTPEVPGASCPVEGSLNELGFMTSLLSSRSSFSNSRFKGIKASPFDLVCIH